MLGSEYNWLISLTRRAPGKPGVRMASDGLFTLAIGMLCLLAMMLHAT